MDFNATQTQEENDFKLLLLLSLMIHKKMGGLYIIDWWVFIISIKYGSSQNMGQYPSSSKHSAHVIKLLSSYTRIVKIIISNEQLPFKLTPLKVAKIETCTHQQIQITNKEKKINDLEQQCIFIFLNYWILAVVNWNLVCPTCSAILLLILLFWRRRKLCNSVGHPFTSSGSAMSGRASVP